MKSILSPEQTLDLIELHDVASSFGAAPVIIGAVALACFLGDLGRDTADVDLVIALDMPDFQKFMSALGSAGWGQEAKREHRWRSLRGSIIDLLPAGPALQADGYLKWPASHLTMSLVGFEHVFTRATAVEFAPDIRFNVAPLPVVALLKIVAHLDDPHRRKKDLDDLKLLLRRYEDGSDRIFCDEVFAAELVDVGDHAGCVLART